MASNDAGSRNICARLVLNDKGTLTITEDSSASIPGTTRNQILSVTGPGGEIKEFFYGKAPSVKAPSRIDPPDNTDSTHVSTSTIGPNKSVLTESQAKSLAVMLSSVNSHVTANDHWALDHSYTMKPAPPVVGLPPPAAVPPKQTKLEGPSEKQVIESIKCSPSSQKTSVYGSANGSSYEIMTSTPSQSSRSSLRAVLEHLPKPNLLPICRTATEGGVSIQNSQNRQSNSAGASEILRQLSASVPVTVGHTSCLTTGPRIQSSQGLNRVPQTTVSKIQENRPLVSGGTGHLKSQQTGSQTGNVVQKPSFVLDCLRDIVSANLKVKGLDVPCNPQSGKDVLNTTRNVSFPSQKPPLNVPIQKRHYPGGAYVDAYPRFRQINIHNQNDIDPVLQRMLKNVKNASASLKETLPVPVSNAFNSNVTPPSKSKSNINASEKGNGRKEVIVRVYPDKPVVALKPDPMKPVNPQSVLPVRTAPPVTFVPEVMQTYYMPVVMTQTSRNSFPLVYNQCVPSGSAGKTIIVTTNTPNLVSSAPATNQTLSTNSIEPGPVSNKGTSSAVPSKPEPMVKAVIDQHNYAAVPKEADMTLPRIESVFPLTLLQERQKQDFDKDKPTVTPNSQPISCLNPGKTTLRKAESVNLEDNLVTSSCLNLGRTTLKEVESVKIEDNSRSSPCLYPGKTKVRKVESVKSGKGIRYHTTIAQFVGDSKPNFENDAPSDASSSTIQASNDDGLASKRRNRKVPKRLILDYPSSSPKSVRKLKVNMRPVIFDPCFVVVEPISFPASFGIAKRKKKKNKESEICSKQCRELFLMKLCQKRHLPGNQCKLKVVEHKNSQGKPEPSFSRTVQAKRRISIDVENKPVSPTKEKQEGPLSSHESASHLPKELETVGTFKISSSNGSKYGVEVPNMASASGTFETIDIGKPTVISTLPLSQVTFDCDRSPGSPSSETVSVVSEACVDSDFSDMSPVKSPEVITRTEESRSQPITSLEKFDGSETTSLPSNDTEEAFEQDEPSPCLESGDLGAPPPVNPSEESSKHVAPFSVPENEENAERKEKGDVKEDVEEESDEEWMNIELEVDPDSEPDEEMDMFVPDNPAPDYASGPEFGLEPEDATAEISSASISNVVLSDKVQRLKAMLAQKMEQVENLRKNRQITN